MMKDQTYAIYEYAIYSVDGGWSEFEEWSACDEVCSGGSQIRIRTCTRPVPEYGGAECVGQSDEARSCNEDPCPGIPRF